MFRNTFLTGFLRFPDGEWRQVTAQINTVAKGISDAVRFMVAPADIELDPGDVTLASRWKTLASMRRRQEALIRADGRRTAGAVSMFLVTAAQATDTKGREPRSEDTAAFMLHLLAVSEGREWRGETDDDRMADAAVILAALQQQVA